MELQLTDQTLWAEGVAARLRLLQASLADEDSAARQRYMAEEIERGLKGIVTNKKKIYLEELSGRFPTWETATAETAAVTASPPAGDDSPEAIVQRLLQVVPELSDSQRTQFAEQLRKAGLNVTVRAEAALEIPKDLIAKLFLTPGQELNLERAIKLLAGLLEWTALLDQPVWRIWKELAPTSRVKKDAFLGGDFKTYAGRYLSDDPETSSQQMSQVLANSRRLIAGILAALAPAAKHYAERYFFRFSPDAIKELAIMERGRGKIFEGVEARCWHKYIELAAGYPTQASVEKEIRDVIAKCVEEVMLGRGASAG